MAYTERYVSVAGGGAHNGTSEANAFTWAEMITDAATPRTGHRYNVIKGAYTSTASDTFTAGTAAAPNCIRGYNSTIGDLDTPRDDPAAAAIDTTNFPVMSYTSTGWLVMGANTIIANVKVTAVRNGNSVSSGTNVLAIHCVFDNSHATGGAAAAYDIATTYGIAVDCDFTNASTNAGSYCLDLGRGCAFSCRFNAAGGGRCCVTGLTSAAIRCAFVAGGVGIDCGGFNCLVAECSFRGLTGINIRGAASNIAVVVNCAAWGGTGSTWYSGNGAVRPQAQAYNAVGNMTNPDSNEGDYPVIGEVSLSGDPFTSSTNLQLNATAGAGAACADAGLGDNLDIGAWQNAATAGSGGGPLVGGRLVG